MRDRSRAISDPWFSELNKKSKERLPNCQMKELADHSKPLPNLKECRHSTDEDKHNKVEGMDQVSIKTPNPKCRLFLKIDPSPYL
jgi:hypothetical protein